MKTIWTFLKSIKHELIAGAVVLVLFYLVAPLMRAIDPTAAPLDIGWLHFFILVPVGLAAAVVAFWVFLNVAMKTLDDWIDSGGMKKDFEEAGPSVRLAMLTKVFGIFMLTFGLIAIAVFQ